MDLGNLFMLSPMKRLELYYGYPWFNSCAKPLSGRQMPVFEYESDEERFTQCGNRSNNNCRCTRHCNRNYYSPFD